MCYSKPTVFFPITENVCFSYDPRQQALKNVSFTIPQGKTVALGDGIAAAFPLLRRGVWTHL